MVVRGSKRDAKSTHFAALGKTSLALIALKFRLYCDEDLLTLPKSGDDKIA